MLKQEIVDYIEREMGRGVSADRIKNALYKVGHDTNHVEEAMRHVKKKRQKVWTFIGVMFFVIIITVVASMLIYTRPQPADISPIGNEFELMEDSKLMNIVYESRDSALCTYMDDDEMKQKCAALAKLEKVTFTDQEVVDRNLMLDARSAKNPEICKDIKDQSLKELCLEMAR